MDQSNDLSLITQRLLEHFSDLLSLHTPDGTVKYISPSVRQLLGYEPDQLIGKSFLNLFHPVDKELGLDAFKENDHDQITYRIRRKEGDYIWFDTIIRPMKEQSISNNELILCISRDITDRKLAEQALKESKEIYRLLVEYSHDTIGIITTEGAFIYINETGKKLFGTTGKAEIIGKSIFDFIQPEDRSKIKEKIMSSNTYPSLNDFIETTIIRSDQERKQIDMKIIPSIYKGRKTKQIIIRDITEQKKTEELLQQTEKLSVVGHLAAGIAHEIRNPLTSIKGFTQLLKDDCNNHYLDVMLSELNRIEKIVSDLLILAKPQFEHFETTDLKKLLEDVVTLLSTQAIMENIEIVLNFSDDEFTIDCEPDKLKQVFINIIKNAIEAMTKEGKILVETSWLNHQKVRIRVHDEGVGIPEERMPKLGEPFYSTKEKGTGLGLMICNKIIKNHHGTLTINSKVNEGTTVEIILPKHQRS